MSRSGLATYWVGFTLAPRSYCAPSLMSGQQTTLEGSTTRVANPSHDAQATNTSGSEPE